MDTIKNIQKVSLFFFIVIGFTHLTSSFILANQYYSYPFNLINRTLDMPFILASLSYGLSSLKISILKYTESRLIDVLLILIAVAVIGVAVYINLIIPDK